MAREDSGLKIDKDFINLGEKFALVDKKAPSHIYTGFDKLGRKIKKDLKKVSPESDKETISKKRLKNRWRNTKTTKEYDAYTQKIYSNAPHFHLVERGHKVVARRASVKGSPKKIQYRVKESTGKKHVEGSKFFEKYMDSHTGDIERDIEKVVDDILDSLME